MRSDLGIVAGSLPRALDGYRRCSTELARFLRDAAD